LSEFVEVRGKQAEGLNFFGEVPAKQMSVDSTVGQIFPPTHTSLLYLLCDSPGNATTLVC
jgi:hypothetical protein